MGDRYSIAEQPAPAPHLAHPAGCAALRILLVTVPRVSRSSEDFPDGFDFHPLLGNLHFGAAGGRRPEHVKGLERWIPSWPRD